MKVFWIKMTAFLAVCLLLLVYQIVADPDKELSGILGGSAGSAGLYNDGVYEGTGEGYKGELNVSVTVYGGEITDIEITEFRDDSVYIRRASSLIEDIIDCQSTEGIDTVSGATYSSRGLLEAVDNALERSEK